MGLGCQVVLGTGCVGVWVLFIGLCLGPAKLGYGSQLLGCVWG